jgi:hypothetical protein
MKFGRNQPRSQPSVRVARLEAIPMRLPSNPPLRGPLSPNLTMPPSIKLGGGRRQVTPIVILSMPGTLIPSDTRWSPPPGRSCPDSGLAIATTSLIGLRKRRRRIAGLSGIVSAERVAQR